MADRVPVKVGQLRDVSTAADRREKIQRLAKVKHIFRATATGQRVLVTDPNGKRPRTTWRHRLERCPVVSEATR